MPNSRQILLTSSFLVLLANSPALAQTAAPAPTPQQVFCQAVLRKTPTVTINYNRTLALSGGQLYATQSIDYTGVFIAPAGPTSYSPGFANGEPAAAPKADAADAGTKFSLSAPTTNFFYGSFWTIIKADSPPNKFQVVLKTATSQMETSEVIVKLRSAGVYEVSASWRTPSAKKEQTPADISAGPFNVALYADKLVAAVVNFDLSHVGYAPLIEAENRTLMEAKGLSFDAATKTISGPRVCKG